MSHTRAFDGSNIFCPGYNQSRYSSYFKQTIMGIELVMSLILGFICIVLYKFAQILSKKDELSPGRWLPSNDNQAKREFELFALGENQLACLALITPDRKTFGRLLGGLDQYLRCGHCDASL
jgi:hypothetical protein